MRNSLLIAKRELTERLRSRSFFLLSLLGPLVILAVIYALFTMGGAPKPHWNVLLVDPGNILENKIMANEDKSIDYSFADGYLEIDEFAHAKRFQKYDAMLEVNEKVLSNKSGFVFFRETPSSKMELRIQYQFERRLEEVLVKQFTQMKVSDFRKIKQPINLSFKNVYDPEGKSEDISGWVGYFYGIVIFIFIFLFGMTILRSISTEKSNRIVEVLLGSVQPKQLLFGKIIGIGVTALIQFSIWVIIIGVGLYAMRENLFPDLLDASKFDVTQLSKEVQNLSYQEQFLAAKEYNKFVELVYQQINFGTMTLFFVLFFIAGYIFYGTFFAALGATMGSENDGQQFILPLLFILLFSLYGGYYVLENPQGEWVQFFQYFPFTAPVVIMVKLAQGFDPGQVYQVYLSLFILVVSSFIVLNLGGRLYSNGILQFGHRLRLRQLFQWLKKT